MSVAQQRAERVALDTGCRYAPQCVSCPWARCISELPSREQAAFATALRLVTGYAAPTGP